MKSHGGNYTSPAELRQRGVLTNLHKIVCAVLLKNHLRRRAPSKRLPLGEVHLRFK